MGLPIRQSFLGIKMIKGIIFDLDGTILYTLDSLAYSTNNVLNKYGLCSQPLEKYKRFVGDGIYVLLEKAFKESGYKGEIGEEIVASFREIFKSNCNYNVKAYDGIIDVLNELKLKNIKIACNSNKPHKNAVQIVELHFPHIFETVVGQQEGVPRKPDKAGGMLIASKFQLNNDEIAYVGDSDVDMMTAKNCGFYSVGAGWGYRGEEELLKNGALFIANVPRDILKIV